MRSLRTLTLAALLAGITLAPAQAQDPEHLAQELANCAGAVAAQGRLNIHAYPQGARGEWAPVLGAILAAMNNERGVEGITGRDAAKAAADYWRDEASTSQREAAANECRARFGGE